MEFMLSFLYHYPLFMAFVWMVGSLVYRMRRVPLSREAKPDLPEYPMISVLIPCHNEEACIRETVIRMMDLDYPNYEVVAIDDGSIDATKKILEELGAEHPKLRTVFLEQNQGKATALKMGALLTSSEYLVCIDADAFLDRNALHWFMSHFLSSPRVGAVTGNPRIRNRTTLLGKIQVGEYSTIVGMIKRTQRVIGKVFTISGVAAAFRKRALLDVGFWSDDMVTEDIDISWKLQTRFWDIRFEEKALCWILTPESLKGLWKQRVRWAQGGAEVMRKYFRNILDRRQRRIWSVYIEYLVSVVWAYCFFFTVGVALLNLFVDLPAPYSAASILPPAWSGTLLAVVCMLQASIAQIFERQVEKGLLRYTFWFIWYPVVYWILNAFAAVAGLPRAFLKKKGTRAIWKSPDRGIQ